MANDTSFKLELGEMRARLEDLKLKLPVAITAAVEEVATFGTTEMKTSAPWHDNTGAARAGLHTDTSHTGNHWEIVFAHAVSYGIWLEVAHSGHWQIIMPTVRVSMERLGHHLQGMFGDIR